jgi:hypothetical protein
VAANAQLSGMPSSISQPAAANRSRVAWISGAAVPAGRDRGATAGAGALFCAVMNRSHAGWSDANGSAVTTTGWPG